jgi:hypothetical protein
MIGVKSLAGGEVVAIHKSSRSIEPSSVLWQQFLRMILPLLLDPFFHENLHITLAR